MGCSASCMRMSSTSDNEVAPLYEPTLVRTSAVNPSLQISEEKAHLPSPDRLPPSKSTNQNNGIAIVGIGCRTPGANDIREFWRVLANGECHVTDIPPDRWNGAAYYDPDPLAPGKAYVQRGGFLTDPFGFDNALYGINDYEASEMDPQQRYMLDCTLMALEDAGITRAQISGTNTGVFVGAMNSDARSSTLAMTSRVNSYTASGKSLSFMSGRLSYVFNLLGPSMVVDTACSASLIAVHQGCQAILSGDCDMAICGGVNSLLLPDAFVHLCKANMISPTGLCHTFSDKADGYTRGEACGVIILKRLQDAERDGDKIWATLCTGTNQDGRTVSPMTSPSGSQQKKLLHFVYDKFGIDVSQLDYIEAHGTGTPVGDPVEVNALGEFFREKGKVRQRYIGSLKTNIGHTESASGVLSVIKLVLMMERELIVPSLHCDVVNPKINLTHLGFVVPRKTIEWPGKPKLVCCNGFGFGGSNCHAILRSHTSPGSDREKRQVPCVVCVAAKTTRSLKGSLQDLYEDEEAVLLDVHDVSFTSTRRRDHYPVRAAFVVNDTQELLMAVGEKLSADDFNTSPVMKKPGVVFVFCGMGTAWKGMCTELLEENPVFRSTMMEMDRLLSSHVTWSLVERLQQIEDPAKDPVFGPIAIFATQVALAAVFQSLGIRPSCVLGQSIGEVAAAYTAGCMSLADAVKIIYHRTRLLAEVSGGSMIVVQNVKVEKVRQLLSTTGDKASIALEYSPNSCAVSADKETMSSLRHTLRSKLRSDNLKMQIIDLDVSVAYHSRYVEPCTGKLTDALNGLKAAPPNVPFVSAVSGSTLNTAPGTQYWVDNLRKPVLMNKAMTTALPEQERSKLLVVEIGPKPVMRSHLQDLFPKEPVSAFPSMSRDSEMKTFLKAVASLYERGADVSWEGLPSQGTKVTPIPRYAFDKKQRVNRSETDFILMNAIDFFHKSHLYTFPVRGSPSCFRLLLSPLTTPSIYEHIVSGTIVIPGVFYVEAGFAIASYVGLDSHPAISVEFKHPVSVKKDAVVDLDAHFERNAGEDKFWKSPVVIQKDNRQHATVWIREGEADTGEVMNVDHIRSRCMDEVSKADIYDTLRKSGFEYGEAFSLLEHAYRSSEECLALLKLNSIVCGEMKTTTIHPCILDCVLQSSAIVMSQNGNAGEDVLPHSIGKLLVHRAMESAMFVHTRLKQKNKNGYFFDQRLLSPSGHVIAELRDFKINVLAPKGDENAQPMITTEWHKMSDLKVENFMSQSPSDKKLIFVTDTTDLDQTATRVVLRYETKDNGIDSLSDRVKDVLSKHSDASALVVISSGKLSDGMGGIAVQSDLVNRCCLIQALMNLLNTFKLSIPFYLCTFNACPAEDDKKRHVNPTATALWGVLRTVVQEQMYPLVSVVELHLSPHQLRGGSLHALFETLAGEDELRDYPEILINSDGVFVSQVSMLDAPVPVQGFQKKQVIYGRPQNAASNTVIVTKSASSVSKALAIRCEGLRDRTSHHFIKLKVQSFARPPDVLLEIRAASSSLLEDKHSSDPSFLVTALEVCGLPTDGSKAEVCSCCPLAVGFEVSVPTDTVLPTSLIPDYKVGDVSRLAVLWELHTMVSAQQMTLLASSDTLHLARMLLLMRSTTPKTSTCKITITTLDELNTATCLEGTVLSLVFLDSSIMSVVIKKWENANHLIALSRLVSPEALSLIMCTCPETEISLVDTQQMFLPQHLKKTVPLIKSWAEGNKEKMKELAKDLHRVSSNTNSRDLSHLLQMEAHILDNLHIQVEDDNLFRNDSVYIVVGGLTGLGWICVEFLAKNSAGYIAILNRRVPSPEQAAEMDKLSQSTQCQIQAFKTDVTSMQSLKEAIRLIQKTSAPMEVRGIFMGAAVIQDSLFTSMSRSAFEEVVSPKVHGAWNLHQITKDLQLDYFVMHSSITSVLGNAGQANYAAGNAFLDGLAHYRRQHGLAAQTINWGPLDTGLLDNQDAVKHKLEAMGFHVATKQGITETLKTLLLLNWTQSVPAQINTQLYAKKILATGSRSLSLRFKKFVSAAPAGGSTLTAGKFGDVSRVKHLDPDKRIQAYEAYVRDLASALTTVDPAAITNDVSLLDLGLDSVTGMSLINQIHRDTSFRLAAVDILVGEVSVASIARALDECARNAG
ncbi:hypothetical protein BaRGS_00000719 [Batillaria attramentaria]|uniref:Polyketide synthase n=1 Tax=Batillaria attramentaria TaxID=370345 RepID=A0ABD0M719_9CAEN